MKPNLAEDIIPVSEFRKNTASFLKTIRSKQRTLILTQDGRSAAIVIDPSAFESLRYERDLFESIAKGENDLAEGRVVSHDRVIKDIKAFLNSL